MRFYAETPVRVTLQVLADVLVLVWVYLCVTGALAARDVLLTLQRPAETLTGAGEGIRDAFTSAAGTAAGIPFVGDELASALGHGTAAGTSLADAGTQTAETVATVATSTAVGLVAVFALPVVVVWLALRVRYARLATAAVAVREADTDLLALRALAGVRVARLLAVSPDPASAWRRDDRDVVRALAALELRRLGLRAPTVLD
ncbi:MAG: hypothetical protein AB7J32_26215 [Pseudonocardia sp.]